MEQNISIDINITKLLDWLISRRHCPKDWQIDISKIRTKINAALQDMPEQKSVAELLSGSFINYFHCLKIVEILRKTEADTKNIFGHYSSQRMKDWNEIISLYQKNNVYLAEAADFIISMNKYDLPNLKKQITKYKQLENEAKKKEVEAQKAGVTLKNELNNLLKELGLSDAESGFKAKLIKSAKDLSNSHDNIVSLTKNITDVINHYTYFAKTTQPNIKIDMSLIEKIADKGNITMFEYIKGYQPSKIILPEFNIEEEEEDVNYDSIDWGLPTEDTDVKQIDIVDAGDLNSPEIIDKTKNDDNIAEGELALSLLDDFKTRSNFINLLLELKAFLKVRIYESQLEGSLDAFVESTVSIEKMLVCVKDILNILNNPTVQHHYYLTHHPRYLEDIVKKINQKKTAIERAATVVEVSKERAKDASSEVQSLNGQVKVLTQKCLLLQDQVAAEISKKYNGRDVFLIGGV